MISLPARSQADCEPQRLYGRWLCLPGRLQLRPHGEAGRWLSNAMLEEYLPRRGGNGNNTPGSKAGHRRACYRHGLV